MWERPPEGIRSISLYKSLFKPLGPLRREQPGELQLRQIFDREGLLQEEESPLGKTLYKRDEGQITEIERLDPQGESAEKEIWEYDNRGNLLNRIIHYKDSEKPEIIEITREQEGRLVLEKQGNRIRAVQRNRDGLIQKELLYTGESPDAVIRYSYDSDNRITEIVKKEPGGTVRTAEERSYNPAGLLARTVLKDSKGGILQELCYEYPAGEDAQWLECRVWAPQTGLLQKKRMLYKLTRELNFYPDEELLLTRPEPPRTVEEPQSPPQEKDPEHVDQEWTSPEWVEIKLRNGVYHGEQKEGKMHGHGQFLFQDGSRYEGNFKEGKMSGKGTLEFPDGRVYQGDFSDNRMEGQGVCLWPNGDRYEGSFRNNLMHGPGQFTWSKGSSFKGLFENNRKTEQGVFLED